MRLSTTVATCFTNGTREDCGYGVSLKESQVLDPTRLSDSSGSCQQRRRTIPFAQLTFAVVKVYKL